MQLDYQLMEHWAPSLPELLQMEEEEAKTQLPSPVEKPQEKREQEEREQEEEMQQQ